MTESQELIFKAMADASRRRILAALCEEPREAGELARLVGLAPNAVSFHLRALKSADLVNVQRDGRFLRYSVETRNLRSWVEHVGQTFRPEWFEPRQALPHNHQKPHTPRTEPDLQVETVAGSLAGWDQLPTELL